MEGKLNIFAVLSKRMDWLSQRQKVLADNIANADTPNFRPRDLIPGEFQRILRNQSPDLSPKATHSAHLQGRVSRGGPARVETQGKSWETSPSGNAVVLEEQLLKVSETKTEYEMMVNLYRKQMDMFRTALRGGG
jgi:flagellar basal-body rod protein FlgB